jgi:ABC-2 type transport system permease protein
LNATVTRESLRQSRKAIGVLALACGAFYYLVLLASSSFLSSGTGGLGSFFANPPKSVTAFLGGTANFFEPEGWLSAAMSHPITIALLTAAGMIVAVSAVATEVERGTIDLALSRPVGRTPYLLGKAVAALVSVTVVEAGGFVGALIARATIDPMSSLPLGGMAVAFLGSWALFCAFAMIALLVSAGSGLRSRANGIAVGIVVGSFFANFIALLIDGAAALRYASPFHYFDPSSLVKLESIGWLGVLGGVAAAGLTGAVVLFARRDLTR